jgi:hypothetical protein
LKTKKVAGVDCSASSFAYVGDPLRPDTWKIPVFVPCDTEKSLNLIKTALYRFSDAVGIPETERQSVWLILTGAAKAHGLKVGEQPPSARPGSAHPCTAQPLDAQDVEAKEARALGSLYADRLLEKIEMEWVR